MYAENFPAEESVTSTGLDRALVPIMTALAKDITCTGLVPRHFRNLKQHLHPAARGAVTPSKLLTALDIVLRRIFGIAPLLSLRALCRAIASTHTPSPGDVALAVLGSDPSSYARAEMFANLLGLPLYIYSVDDPKGHHRELSRIFSRCKGIFTITAQLGALFHSRFNANCLPLPLPYMSAEISRHNKVDQVIFVGNISHLYASALLDVIDAISEIRAQTGRDISLRMTTPARVVSDVLGELPPFVIVGEIQDRSALLAEIANSRCAVCPIAFDDASEMVLTSFPSKVLDYLSQSECIIVYGPSNSAASEYFRREGLPFVANDKVALSTAIYEIFTMKPDFRNEYTKVLRDNHGLENFRAAVLSELTVTLVTEAASVASSTAK